MPFDIIQIAPRGCIAQGDARSACEDAAKFDLIVFCAAEFQPKRELVTRLSDKVFFLYAPFDDGDLSKKELQTATNAATNVAEAFDRQKRRVLVTCMQGRNRSGLVVALALHMIHGMGGEAAREVIRQRRKGAEALTNPSFNKLLSGIAPRPVDLHALAQRTGIRSGLLPPASHGHLGQFALQQRRRA